MPRPRTTPHFSSQSCADRVGVVTIGQHRRDGVAALNGSDDVEADDLAFRPNADGASHRLGQQPVASEYVLQPLFEQQVERLAQGVQQMSGGVPAYFR